jgi:hypothetical protein
MRPRNTSELQILSKAFERPGNEHFCLHVTWHQNLPSELYLKIDTSTNNSSRSYKLFEITWKMEIRLEKNLSFHDKYSVTLSFKTYGGLSNVRSCSKKGNLVRNATVTLKIKTTYLVAIQIIHSKYDLRGCQLLMK